MSAAICMSFVYLFKFKEVLYAFKLFFFMFMLMAIFLSMAEDSTASYTNAVLCTELITPVCLVIINQQLVHTRYTRKKHTVFTSTCLAVEIFTYTNENCIILTAWIDQT